ncbi:MAG: hypothetical protein WAV89_00655 [Ignavibacteriaceae bacterium]
MLATKIVGVISKTILNTFLFFTFMFVFTFCDDVTSPVENATISKGEYSGIFSVTLRHYKIIILL